MSQSTAATNLALVRRATGWGVLVFMITAALMLPMSWKQFLRNQADLEAATRVQTVETAVRLQQEIDHHLRLLETLAARLRLEGRYSEQAFEREAEVLVAAWPAFQAINWAGPDGVIRSVVPREANLPALGMNILEVPDAAPAFRRALASGVLAATPPLELKQGGRGVATYLAVREGDEVRGVINGVFRLETLFGSLVGDGLLERYALAVSDAGEAVYSVGEIGASFADRPRTSIIFDRRSWQLLLAPRAERVADFGAQFREEVLGITGVALFAGLLAGLLGYKQLSLRLTERRFRDLNELLPDMVLECDEHWRVTYLNRLASEQLGYREAEVAAGLALQRLFGAGAVSEYAAELDNLPQNASITRICAVQCRDGGATSCEITLAAVRDEQGAFRGLRAVLRDITERLEAERAMNRLANFDSTTQLPNRAMFLQVLGHEIRQAQVHGGRLVLMVIDLDNFKHINDRLGPSMGDVLLREAGQRLREALNREEYVFRVSGDEFAVLFDNLDNHAAIEGMARRLQEALRRPYRLRGGAEEVVSATIGASVYPDDAANAEQLYMHADAAVYEAKAEGGRRCRVFTHEISRQLNERKQLEESLRHAIRRNELRLYYQPVIDAAAGGVTGVEALLRWEHPERGLLSPYHFVRLAEETGQIDEIGAWVLDEACRQMIAWDREGVHVPQVAVNVSAHQLESGVLDADVRRALRDSGLDGARLVIELTESLLMRDVHFAAHMLTGLKRHGVRSAVDDFGTGYSSLAYLNRLPLDALKIDRAFIAPIAEEGGDTRVIEAIIALGRSLKLHIVAEGVEQEDQADFLLEHGCRAMQGYLFSRPVPPVEIPELVAREWRRAQSARMKVG